MFRFIEDTILFSKTIKMIEFFLYYLYMMQKSTKIALISGSILAISLGAFFWYRKRKTQKEQQSGNVLTDLEKIYNQLLSGSRPTSQGGTQQGGTQSGTQRSGQDESQRQSYKEPTQSSQSSQTQTANQKQLEQQKKQEEQFFKPKDSQQQPQSPMQYNDAQYNLPAYGSGGDSGYNTGGYNSNTGGYSSMGAYGNSWLNGERGYGGNISDY